MPNLIEASNNDSFVYGSQGNARRYRPTHRFVMDVNKAGQVWIAYNFYPANLIDDENEFRSINTLLLMRLDKNLNVELIRTYGGQEFDDIQDLRVLEDGGVLISGETNSITNSTDAWVLRLGSDGLIQNSCSALMDAVAGTEQSDHYFETVDLPLFTSDDALLSHIVMDTTTEYREVYDILDPLLRIIPTHDKIVVGRSCSGPAKTLQSFFPATQKLTITPPSNGKIIDNSRPTLIDCGSGEAISCQASYGGISPDITSTTNGLALTAVADDLFIFKDWTGDCAGIEGNNSSGNVINVDMNTDTTCSATFIRGTPPITTADFIVSLAGSGTGSVTSGNADIDCGTDCSETYDLDSQVRFTAFPDAGNQFSSWSGTGDCAVSSSQAVKTITVSQNSNCVATFEPIAATGDVTLTVIILGGPGVGEINSTEAGIAPILQCLNSFEQTSTCTATYPSGSFVALQASPSAPFTINNVSWTGCLPFENNDCALTMTQDTTVTATFTQPVASTTYNISASVLGNGSIVSSVPTGITGSIDCPSNCSDLFIVETSGSITFTAVPDASGSAVFWGPNQCDSESNINGVRTCTINVINGSPPSLNISVDVSFI